MDLERKFDLEMENIYRRAKDECNYTPTVFLRMLHQHRGVLTAKKLINAAAVSEGYTRLFELGRLDLTVEAVVLENPAWHSLFTPEEIEKCRKRLSDYDYKKA